MRNIFDKLEKASNLVRLGILAIMLLILVSGLIFLKPAQKNTGSAKTVSYSRRSSSSKASSTKKASSEDNTIQDAEVAVKKLEEERTDESLTPAPSSSPEVTPSPSSEIPSPSSDTSGASSNTVVPSQTSSEK